MRAMCAIARSRESARAREVDGERSVAREAICDDETQAASETRERASGVGIERPVTIGTRDDMGRDG